MKKLPLFLKEIRIRATPRYTEAVTTYLGFPCVMADKSSFLFMKKEIFDKEIYKFHAESAKPFIIDCGANIGLSAIYFKKMHPEATVLAFEADRKIFGLLEKNIKASGATGVTLVNKAVGAETKTMSFFSEGADGGRIATKHDTKDVSTVECVRLSSYIDRKVDFLKIDIEGAEVAVLKECTGVLHNVKNIFIEYHSLSSRPQELDVLLSILTTAGFRYYIESVGVTSKHPFIKIEEHLNYDLQLNISAYRSVHKSAHTGTHNG